MKKLRLFFLMVVALQLLPFLSNNSVYGAEIPSYFINENFTGLAAYPTGWSAGTALYAGSSAVNWTSPASDQLNASGGGGGNRGITLNFPSSGTESTVYVDFDWFITARTVGQKNAVGFTLDASESSVATPLTILCLYLTGSDGKFHYANMDLDTIAVATGGDFKRASSVNVAGTNACNFQTQIDFAASIGVWYNIKAVLDFTNKTVSSLTITNKSDNSSITVSTAYSFMTNASSITNVSKISFFGTRGSNAGNGSNSNFNFSIDNFKTYKMIDVTTSSVTVNYLNASDNSILKTARVEADLEVGSVYTAIAGDKATFSDANNYYIYNASASTDNVIVTPDGSAAINLKFNAVPTMSGTYVWTGATSSNWNESEANFSVSGGADMAYQQGNGVEFSNVGALNKNIAIGGEWNLGANNMVISATGYSFGGSGKLSGTGTTYVNAATELNVENELVGGVTIAENTVVDVKKSNAAAKFTMGNGSELRLETGAAFSTPIEGMQSITLSLVSDYAYYPVITDASEINISLETAGRFSLAAWTSAWTGTFPVGAQINITTTLGNAGFGTTDALLANNKLHLGDNVRLLREYNESSAGTSAKNIGELSGTASSTIEGGFVDGRKMAYNIGGLNTDAVFAGVIKNYSGSRELNINKVGTGKWTLTGISTFDNGTFNVNAGTLVMDGELSAATVPMVIAAGATLSGSGTIAGATTLNGVLDATSSYLSFGSNLTIDSSVNINANAAESIIVGGNLDAANGTLNVGATVSEYATGDKVALFTVTGTITAFPTININGVGVESQNDFEVIIEDNAIKLHCIKVATGIGENQVDELVDVKYYTIQGFEIKQPVRGAVTIVSKIYSSGLTTTEKVVFGKNDK